VRRRSLRFVAEHEDEWLADYLAAAERTPVIGPDEERGLVDAWLGGDDARRRLEEGSRRLVVSIAAQYESRSRPIQMPALVKAGDYGLTQAVAKFDPTKGFQFTTYATWWIRQAIERAVGDAGPSRHSAN
jgi:DNA-directed RNA polymerase sigma subunit (sigma70/sigma32)